MTQAEAPRAFLLDLTANSFPYDHRLYEAVRAAGADVRLFASGVPEYVEGRALPSAEGLMDGAVVRLGRGRLRRPLKAIEYFWNLGAVARRVARERPGVVHVQWLPFIKVAPSVELGFLDRLRSHGARIVYTVHNVLPHEGGERYRATYRRVYQAADGLVCHTEASRAQVVEEFGVDPSRVRVIRHGPLDIVASKVEPEVARRALGYAPEAAVALLFGNVRPYKGAEFLIGAWRRVAERHPTARLVIAGNGAADYVATLQARVAEYGLGRSVETRFEFVPDGELAQLIAGADVLVYPYREITQSGALLTALAAGKAVVATRVGGFAETLDDGRSGLLVDYGDEAALAEALEAALFDPARRRALEAGAAELMDGEYSWDRIGEATCAFYRDVIAGEPVSRSATLSGGAAVGSAPPVAL